MGPGVEGDPGGGWQSSFFRGIEEEASLSLDGRK